MSEHSAFLYYTIEQSAEAEYKDRGSRFIGISFPVQSVDDFKKGLLDIKIKYPKANHYCYAYVIGVDGSLYKSTDDGEPSGTAG